MKKFFLVAAMVLGFAVAASAQPRALGAKFGWGLDLSYQHGFGADFLEVDLGLNNFNALNVAGVYNFMIAQPAWTDRGEWGVYAGPGANLGLGFNGWFNVAVCGQVGLEYTFNFPLQISLDVRPQFSFTNFGFWGWAPHLGLRYRF